MPNRTRYNVCPEAFISAWQASETLDEVAERTEMPLPIFSARASTYRSKGIKLKKLRRGLDIKGLNKLVRETRAAAPSGRRRGGTGRRGGKCPRGGAGRQRRVESKI